ncbi:MAG: hypothetical protein GX593_03300 [Actinomycetales bacterium]|nr:hypothetical protein [Actinomycetales bacterium]
MALTAVLAVTGVAAAHADEIDLDVEIPTVTDQPFEVTDARLRWGINEETGSGAFAGGCNFLSAGKAGDTGGSVWTEDDGHFRASDGDVTIERPVATSKGLRYRPVTFADRCKDAHGRTVSASGKLGTGIQLVVDGGTGRVDPASGDAKISWKGSVSVVFYGGMTSWWFTDPVLTIKDGRGTLTATASGYESSREEMTQGDLIKPTRITLAKLSDVSLRGDKGFSAQPAYLGVKVSVPDGAPAQLRSGDTWGAFPQDFVDFQELTGQQAFWYSSGGARDVAKPATVLGVSYDAADPETPTDPRPDEDVPDDEDEAGPTPKNPVTPPPSKTPPPAVNLPPSAATGTSVGGADRAPGAVPAAVPSTTVLPASAPLALAPPVPAPEPGAASRGIVLAAAGLLLGAALTLLGFRRRVLVWPGTKGGV